MPVVKQVPKKKEGPLGRAHRERLAVSPTPGPLGTVIDAGSGALSDIGDSIWQGMQAMKGEPVEMEAPGPGYALDSATALGPAAMGSVIGKGALPRAGTPVMSESQLKLASQLADLELPALPGRSAMRELGVKDALNLLEQIRGQPDTVIQPRVLMGTRDEMADDMARSMMGSSDDFAETRVDFSRPTGAQSTEGAVTPGDFGLEDVLLEDRPASAGLDDPPIDPTVISPTVIRPQPSQSMAMGDPQRRQKVLAAGLTGAAAGTAAVAGAAKPLKKALGPKREKKQPEVRAVPGVAAKSKKR